MTIPCPEKLACDCRDNPVLNLSAEGLDNLFIEPFISQIVLPNVPPLGGGNAQAFNAQSCVGTCVSLISQQDADDCAMETAVICDDSANNRFCNTAQIGTFICPDGSIFVITVPAGMICQPNQNLADRYALSMAEQEARNLHFCVRYSAMCTCAGTAQSFNVTIQGGAGPFVVVPFSLPSGISVVLTSSRNIRVTVNRSTPGTVSAGFRISTQSRGELIVGLVIRVIQITTNDLPALVIGDPYSAQLSATGGSGNYRWSIVSGSLPDGLTLSSTGLISGTPTSSDDATFTVKAHDTAC